MKKILYLLSVILLSAALFTSCFGGQGDPPEEPGVGEIDENVVFSPDVTVTVVRADGVSPELAAKVVGAVRLKSGRMPRVADSSSTPSEHEIVIGDAGRAVSRSALGYLDEKLDPEARLGGYAFYSEGTSVAIVFSREALATDAVNAFIEKYIVAEKLPSTAQIRDVLPFELPPVDAEAWATRFDVYGPLLDDNALAALKRIYALFDEKTVEWMANLWEPYNCVCGECEGELACFGGGFYYANSSRDYVGFLPDVESTSQLLGLVRGYGMISGYNNDIRLALPEDMQAAIVKFVQSLQSESDKYFYHPQWGTGINSSRRGRDLDSSLGLLRQLGAEPLYGSPLSSSAGAATANNLTRPLGNGRAAAVSTVLSTSTLPDYLRSEDAFRAWLEALDINGVGRSYSAGHTISSIRSQIKAAGLDKFCIEWLNSKQLDNGLWEEGEVTYAKTNGLLKISTMYESWSAELPRVQQGIDAFVAMLYSDVPVSQITDIYNIWVGLGILIPNLRSFGEAADYRAAVSALRADAESIFNKTLEKLLVFRKDDGSFSYLPKASASSSQGAPASLGYNEGDVNATALAHGTLSNMLKALDMTRVDYYNNDHLELFLSIVTTLNPVEKQVIESSVVDFNDYSTDERPVEVTHSSSVTSGEPGILEIKEHSDKKGDMYLELSSSAGCGDSLRRGIVNYGPTSCFVFDADLCFMGGGIQIFVGSSVMLTVNASGDKIKIGDLNARTGGNISNDIATVNRNEWINLRVEHYPDAAMTKFFIDGELVKLSDNFLGKTVAGNTRPTTNFTGVEIYATISAATSFAVDDLLVDRTTDTYVAPEGTTPDDGGEDEPAGDTVTLPDSPGKGSFFNTYGGQDYSGTALDPSALWIHGGTVLNGDPKNDANAYARIVKNGDDGVLEYAKLTGTVAERHIGWKAVGEGDIYVFETDFLYTGCLLDNADPWPIRFALQGTASSIDRIASLIFRIDTATGDLKHSATSTVLKRGEWHTIGIRYDSTTGAYEYLLNGTSFYQGTASAGLEIRGVSAELRAYASELTVYFDNTCSQRAAK